MLWIKEHAEDVKTHSTSEQWPIGLSTGELGVQIESRIQSMNNPQTGQHCGTLQHVIVRLGFQNNWIYVARELPRRSCPYKMVLEHEEKHKNVDSELLEEYTKLAEEFFTEKVGSLKPIFTKNTNDIQNGFDGELNDALKAFSEKMNAEREQRQQQVDTPEEYARISASCDGQTQQIISDRLELIENSDNETINIIRHRQ